MKIGILTLPLHTNYGGILQAYALQTVLKRMGHEVLVIDKRQNKTMPSYFTYFKRYVKKYIFGKKIVIYKEKIYNKSYPFVSRFTQLFIDEYIQHVYIDVCELKENQFDAYIVGSDQIWRPMYYKPIENAFLNFTDGWDVIRISYAPSFGTDQWEYTDFETDSCAKLAARFDAISVREASAVDLCKRYLKVAAQNVLDPTLLLNLDDYVSLFKDDQTDINSPYTLTYILDESQRSKEIVDYLVNEERKIVKKANGKFEDISAPIEQRVQPPVESWLAHFYYSEAIITDSFHACIFSIIFHKPFYVLKNKERGFARINSLLTQLGLEKQVIVNMDGYIKVRNNKIDYQVVEKKLSELRETSLSFLIDNLNK